MDLSTFVVQFLPNVKGFFAYNGDSFRFVTFAETNEFLSYFKYGTTAEQFEDLTDGLYELLANYDVDTQIATVTILEKENGLLFEFVACDKMPASYFQEQPDSFYFQEIAMPIGYKILEHDDQSRSVNYTVKLIDPNYEEFIFDHLLEEDENAKQIDENTFSIEAYESNLYDYYSKNEGLVEITPKVPDYFATGVIRAGTKQLICWCNGYKELLPLLYEMHKTCVKEETIVMFEDKKEKKIEFVTMERPKDWVFDCDHHFLEDFSGTLAVNDQGYILFENAESWFGS